MVTQLSRREKRAILLSTHRLEDAEKLCNHVMIINKGRSVATGTPESLRKKTVKAPVLEVVLKPGDATLAEDAIRRIESVKALAADGPRLLITLDDPDSATPKVVSAIVQAGGQVLSVNLLKPSLEEIYLKLIREAG